LPCFADKYEDKLRRDGALQLLTHDPGVRAMQSVVAVFYEDSSKQYVTSIIDRNFLTSYRNNSFSRPCTMEWKVLRALCADSFSSPHVE